MLAKSINSWDKLKKALCAYYTHNTIKEFNIFDLQIVNPLVGETLNKFFSCLKTTFTKTTNIFKEVAILTLVYSLIKGSDFLNEILKKLLKTSSDM